MFKVPRRIQLPVYLRREALHLTALTGMAIVSFAGVAALSRLHSAQEDALSDRWSTRAATDLNTGNYAAAASEYRSALRYSQDSYSQQLGLAEALLGLKKTNEASAYLVNLWEQQPENGVVNRELARIAAGKNDTRSALRYYHNAIYAHWPGNSDTDQRNTRWELIKYLLGLKAIAQAQSELISLAAEVGDDPTQQLLLGHYFLQVQDSGHALAAFRLALKADPHNPDALAGAGTAAFKMGDYGIAARYLSAAQQQDRGNHALAAQLETVEQVRHLDPFRGQISTAEQARAVLDSFAVAGQALQSCPAVGALPESNTSKQTLVQAWAQWKPKVSPANLRRDPDQVNQIMDLVFNIERQAGGKCSPTPSDTALLLISKMHEGS